MASVKLPRGVGQGGSAVLQSPSGFVPPSSKGMDKFMELYYDEHRSDESEMSGRDDEDDVQVGSIPPQRILCVHWHRSDQNS